MSDDLIEATGLGALARHLEELTRQPHVIAVPGAQPANAAVLVDPAAMAEALALYEKRGGKVPWS